MNQLVIVPSADAYISVDKDGNEVRGKLFIDTDGVVMFVPDDLPEDAPDN